MTKSRLLLLIWFLILLVASLAYQVLAPGATLTALIWGVPTVIGLIASLTLTNWRSVGERGVLAFWVVAIVATGLTTIVAYAVEPVSGFLLYGMFTWSLVLSVGYITTGLALGWRFSIILGVLSFAIAFLLLAGLAVSAISNLEVAIFGVAHAIVVLLLAIRS